MSKYPKRKLQFPSKAKLRKLWKTASKGILHQPCDFQEASSKLKPSLFVKLAPSNRSRQMVVRAITFDSSTIFYVDAIKECTKTIDPNETNIELGVFIKPMTDINSSFSQIRRSSISRGLFNRNSSNSY